MQDNYFTMKKRLGSVTYIHIPKSNNLIWVQKFLNHDIPVFFFKMHEPKDGESFEIASAIHPSKIEQIKNRDDIYIREFDYPIYQNKIASLVKEMIEVLEFNNIRLPADNKKIEILEKRVKVLDKIETEVSRFYPNEDEQHNEVVGDIGEITARILGYL